VYDLLHGTRGSGVDDVDLRVGGVVPFVGGVPMTGPFQRAVKGKISRERRREAIDALAADGRTTDLATLVRTRGLPGGLRRRALAGLSECQANAELADIAADRSLPPEIRRTAERK